MTTSALPPHLRYAPGMGEDVPVEDPVNHPSHYLICIPGQSPIEVIDIIEALQLNYYRGNALKYICRAGRKVGVDAVTDLKKAVWYLNREVEGMERMETDK